MDGQSVVDRSQALTVAGARREKPSITRRLPSDKLAPLEPRLDTPCALAEGFDAVPSPR